MSTSTVSWSTIKIIFFYSTVQQPTSPYNWLHTTNAVSTLRAALDPTGPPQAPCDNKTARKINVHFAAKGKNQENKGAKKRKNGKKEEKWLLFLVFLFRSWCQKLGTVTRSQITRVNNDHIKKENCMIF